MTTKLTSFPRLADFLVSEANNQRSRENIVVTQSGAEVKSGSLLTKLGDTGTAAFAMDAGSTGNPTAGTITVTAPAKPGVYRIIFRSATTFDVEDPDGIIVDNGATGVAFNAGGLAFTLTAGGTPAVAQDTAKITVAVGNGKYAPYTASGAAGPADAVLYNYLPAKTGDSKAVAFVRDCEVNRHGLTGLDATGESGLAAKGIIVRGTAGLGKVATPAL